MKIFFCICVCEILYNFVFNFICVFQVFRLVIFYEEVEDGNVMSDLVRFVQTVKLVVDNLVKVSFFYSSIQYGSRYYLFVILCRVIKVS